MTKNSFSGLRIEDLIFLLVSQIFIVNFCYLLFIRIVDLGIPFKDPVTEYIIYSVYWAVICWCLRRKLNRLDISLKAILGKFSINRWRSIKLFGLVTIKICFSLGTVLLTFSFLQLVVPSFVQSILDYANAKSQTSLSLGYYHTFEIFASVIVAPLAEEFVFRGVLLHVLANKRSVSLSILLSSLIFGCLHLSPIGASIAGIIYSLLYIKSRSLFIPIMAHAINNAIATISPLFLERIIDDLNEMPTIETVSNMWKPGLLLVVISAPLILRFIYRQYPNTNTQLPYFANTINNADFLAN